MRTISVKQAVTVGQIVVNVPVILILFSPLFFTLKRFGEFDKHGLLALFCGFLMAWLFWSICVPRWRLWAYKRVNSITELKVAAINAGLIWPPGNVFERTEIVTSHLNDKLTELERTKP